MTAYKLRNKVALILLVVNSIIHTATLIKTVPMGTKHPSYTITCIAGLYILRTFRPFPALPDTFAIVAMFRIVRVLRQQFAWNIGTLTAMDVPLVLAAYSHRAFTVERVSVRLDATAAPVAIFPLASCTMQTAP